MESLTSFLLSEQELSLDAFTDSMLANLPQQADGICNLDPIVPFQTLPGKEPGTHNMHGPSVVKALVWCLVFGYCASGTRCAGWSVQYVIDAPIPSSAGLGAPFDLLKHGAGFPQQEMWDAVMLGPQTDATAPAAPFHTQLMHTPAQSLPATSGYMQSVPLPQSAAQMPPVQEKSSSPRSSDGKSEPDFAKLQERIQKQKEKNARNQRQFRKRVGGHLSAQFSMPAMHGITLSKSGVSTTQVYLSM